MLEQTVLSNLVCNERYARKVLPFLKREYFSDTSDQVILHLIGAYYNKYNSQPSPDALKIQVQNAQLKESVFEKAVAKIDAFKQLPEDYEWLVDTTEVFCQQKAVANALQKSIVIYDENKKKSDQGLVSLGNIPQLLTDAIAVSFDSHVGHDYFEDAESRFDSYTVTSRKFPFDLQMMNMITDGGIEPGSLTIAMAGTGVGKSLWMCHVAAGAISMGYDVLYITMEMSEEKISERIDANRLNINIKDIKNLKKDMFLSKIKAIQDKTAGRLIVKQYPTGAAHAGHFRHLINELKIKKNFKPKLLIVDYLNICSSSRIKAGGGSYDYMKAIAEELRGLGVEFGIPVITGTQVNREGAKQSDFDMTNVADSYGLAYTADLAFGMMTSDELEKAGLIQIKQLKNRYGDKTINEKFTIGIDKPKMQLFDADSSSIPDSTDTTSVFDSTDMAAQSGVSEFKDFLM